MCARSDSTWSDPQAISTPRDTETTFATVSTRVGSYRGLSIISIADAAPSSLGLLIRSITQGESELFVVG